MRGASDAKLWGDLAVLLVLSSAEASGAICEGAACGRASSLRWQGIPLNEQALLPGGLLGEGSLCLPRVLLVICPTDTENKHTHFCR